MILSNRRLNQGVVIDRQDEAARVPAAGYRPGSEVAATPRARGLYHVTKRLIDVTVATGRVAVLTYHSGEDRLVKQRFATAATGGCTCPPGVPCVCGAVAKVRRVRAPRTPSAEQAERNPRARSARLRVVEKLTAESR